MDCKNGIIGHGHFGKGVAVCNLEFGIHDLEFGLELCTLTVSSEAKARSLHTWIGRIVYLQFEEL
jgi:hypothetical protein